MNIVHYRDDVVIPTLEILAPQIPYTDAAVNLILMTAVAESNLVYLHQNGGGPALGVLQMEPATEASIWQHYLIRKPELKCKVQSMTLKGIDRKLNLASNLVYQVAMARLKYWPDAEALPNINDIDGMCNYYLRIYNTVGGKANFEKVHSIYKYRILQ